MLTLDTPRDALKPRAAGRGFVLPRHMVSVLHEGFREAAAHGPVLSASSSGLQDISTCWDAGDRPGHCQECPKDQTPGPYSSASVLGLRDRESLIQSPERGGRAHSQVGDRFSLCSFISCSRSSMAQRCPLSTTNVGLYTKAPLDLNIRTGMSSERSRKRPLGQGPHT